MLAEIELWEKVYRTASNTGILTRLDARHRHRHHRRSCGGSRRGAGARAVRGTRLHPGADWQGPEAGGLVAHRHALSEDHAQPNRAQWWRAQDRAAVRRPTDHRVRRTSRDQATVHLARRRTRHHSARRAALCGPVTAPCNSPTTPSRCCMREHGYNCRQQPPRREQRRRPPAQRPGRLVLADRQPLQWARAARFRSVVLASNMITSGMSDGAAVNMLRGLY